VTAEDNISMNDGHLCRFTLQPDAEQSAPYESLVKKKPLLHWIWVNQKQVKFDLVVFGKGGKKSKSDTIRFHPRLRKYGKDK
jgi:hypothetical protein